MSQLEVDKIVPQSGTTLTIGDSGDTINFADGQNISIDTNTLYIDSTNNRVGIGTTSPTNELHIETSSSVSQRIKTTSSSSSASLLLDGGASNDSTYRWLGGGTQYYQMFRDGSQGQDLRLISSADTAGATDILRYSINGDLRFATNASERMRITSSGNVGIGTSSPSHELDIQSSGDVTQQLKTTSSSNNVISYFDGGVNADSQIRWLGDGTNYYQLYRDGSQNQDLRLYSPTDTAGATDILRYTINGDLRFGTSASERVRIDSSGNLLVGQTSSNYNATGIALKPNSLSHFTTDSNYSLLLNRKTNDGDIVRFYRDTTTVGKIGVIGGLLSVGSGDTGIKFWSAGDAVAPSNPDSSHANRDASIDIGTSSNRFKDAYLSGGLYVGGTGSANYLDDYEEGTWTPTWTVASGSIASVGAKGKYIKIGKRVFIWGDMKHSGNTSASGVVGMTGLPFAATEPVGHSNNKYGTIRLSDQSLWTGTPPSIGLIYSSTAIRLYVQTVPTSIGTQLDFSAFWTGYNYSQFTFYGAYTAT